VQDVQPKLLLLESSLERAAEVLGDITEPAMSRFYEGYPEAKASFEHHGLGKTEKLEATMVENALFWAMNWLERPTEIIIQVGGSVPHHQDTLKVTLAWYRGLVESVIDVIADTIPADRGEELAVWRQIRGELGGAIESSKSTFRPHVSAAA
jgi:hypothetical protein